MNRIVEGVFDKKYNRNTFGNIPKWFWILLVYFAYDDILAIISFFAGPYILVLMLAMGGGAAYLASTGQLDKVVALL